MKQVIDSYLKAISHQIERRNRQGREKFTTNEEKALLWYGKAVQQLEALCSQ